MLLTVSPRSSTDGSLQAAGGLRPQAAQGLRHNLTRPPSGPVPRAAAAASACAACDPCCWQIAQWLCARLYGGVVLHGAGRCCVAVLACSIFVRGSQCGNTDVRTQEELRALTAEGCRQKLVSRVVSVVSVGLPGRQLGTAGAAARPTNVQSAAFSSGPTSAPLIHARVHAHACTAAHTARSPLCGPSVSPTCVG